MHFFAANTILVIRTFTVFILIPCWARILVATSPFFYSMKAVNFLARALILELGYFVGMMGRSRVCCLYKGDLELPSDIHGVIYKKFEKSIDDCYRGIIEELKAAGYEIKT